MAESRKTRIVIDGNAFYEIDETCLERKMTANAEKIRQHEKGQLQRREGKRNGAV